MPTSSVPACKTRNRLEIHRDQYFALLQAKHLQCPIDDEKYAGCPLALLGDCKVKQRYFWIDAHVKKQKGEDNIKRGVLVGRLSK